jgi:hypothetical protein
MVVNNALNVSIQTPAGMAEIMNDRAVKATEEAAMIRSRIKEKRSARFVPERYHDLAPDEAGPVRHWVPKCPGCGNNDTRADSTGSLLPVAKYSTSGWDMKCLACGATTWRFFCPPMQAWISERQETQNALAVVAEWDNNTWD